MTDALAPDSVAEGLRSKDTRDATLTALEAHDAPLDRAVALAAAPVLCWLRSLTASEVGHKQWDRACLLFARVLAESLAQDDLLEVYVAGFGGGRHAASYRADNVVARAHRKSAAELELADARSFVSSWGAGLSYCEVRQR